MTTKPSDNTLAIIGGGASATLFLAHFTAIKNAAPRNIIIFDRAGRFGKGVAYGTKNKNHLLNIRTRIMTAYQDKPHHFSEWAATKGYDPNTFAPRMVYGEYLQDILDEAIENAGKNGHGLSFIKANVTAVKKENDGYVIESQHENYKVSDVILATGNSAPVIPKGAEKLSIIDGYHPEPWAVDYEKIQGDVILLGTGLSMIDAVLSLNAVGFQGNMTAISRRGLVPAPHIAPFDEYPAFIKDLPSTPLKMLRAIRAETEAAAVKNIPWQAVVDSLRPFTNQIWKSWPEDQRKKFLKRLFAFWSIHRHRMPPEAHEIVQSLRARNKLRIVRDSIEKIEGGIKIHGREKIHEAPNVINCLGYANGPPRGFEATHRIGPALWGPLLETTALQEIRAQAAALAKEIAGA